MKTITYLLLLLSIFLSPHTVAEKNTFAIAIHGGAGTILESKITTAEEKAYRNKLSEAIVVGSLLLKKGGSSLDAVSAAIVILEDSPLFNAGAGAVYTRTGGHELDASIMSGIDLSAGAVAGVAGVKNPIILARKVMENSEHVMLSGDGANEFARSQGLKLLPQSYFDTQRRLESWKKANGIETKHKEKKSNTQSSLITPATIDYKFGTVGAVALDQQGNLAAGTSTGGMTNKRFGRIGDSPIVGAGMYANNKSCAVSATGHGEYFIRYTVAHDICARKQYLGLSLQEATNEVINKELVAAGGSGGVIAIDAEGNISLQFNTEGMYRAYSSNGAAPVISIFKE